MVLMHKEGKLFSWVVGAGQGNVIILKGALGIQSLLTDRSTFIKTSFKNWDFLSQTSSICNVWKSIWSCGKRSWAEGKGGTQEGVRLRRIRSEPGKLPFSSAGISIPWNWVCGAPLLYCESLPYHWCIVEWIEFAPLHPPAMTYLWL